jgi:DNA helicase-2/ATP-dependent DNA helicase PcrA
VNTMPSGQAVPPEHAYQPWRDFAILYRSNAQSRIFEEALRLHSIPYKLVGALSFLDRKEVKDLLCYWKLVLNPNDDASIRRVVNWPARGIGKSSLTLIHEYSVAHGVSFYDAMNCAEVQAQLNERGKKGIAHFRETLARLSSQLHQIERSQYQGQDNLFLGAISEWAKKSLDAIGVRSALQAEEDDVAKAQRRLENLEELGHAIGMFDLAAETQPELHQSGASVMQDYLSQLILNSKEELENDKETDQNALTLMTLHGAKGLEWPVVFLVGLEDGNLPHQRTIDEGTDLSEERRLFYVGITRARDELYLTRCKNRTRYGKAVPRNPCRFLEDIPEDLILERDESSTPDFKSEEAKAKHEEEVMNFFAEIQSRLKK